MDCIVFPRGAVFSALVLLVSLLAGCGGDEDARVETWEINHHERECVGLQPGLCLMVRSTAGEPWSNQFTGISGFSYALGTSYKIEVRITNVKNPPADGSSLAFALERILSESRVPPETTFRLSVAESESARAIDATTYELFGRRTMVCSGSDCQTIESALAAESGMLLAFDHQNSPAGPMRLVSIVCTAPRLEFRQTCLSV